jgi:hypothetical protein
LSDLEKMEFVCEVISRRDGHGMKKKKNSEKKMKGKEERNSTISHCSVS